jgi:hypothetical protein
LDWYYFGARFYDAEVGRFFSPDPLASKYPSLSPYNYCANNPLIYIDPTGEEIETTEEDMKRLKQMLPKEVDNYLKIKAGSINAQELAKAGLDDETYIAVLELAQSKEIYVYSSGNKLMRKGDSEPLEINFPGMAGYTLEKELSKSGKNEIIVSEKLRGKKLVEFTAHEFGHGVLLDRSRKNKNIKWIHTIKYDEKLKGHTDKNIQLRNLQKRLVQIALSNYSIRHGVK